MTAKTKKVVIKEELVELTGDYKLAIVLNQMIYWSERVSDFDRFINEEKIRLSSENMDSDNMVFLNGWIYKTAEELAKECMITNSEATMRRHLDKLVEFGWLDIRRNPKYKWDKTYQYRVDLKKIQFDLFEKGYALEGYRIDLTNRIFKMKVPTFKMTNQTIQNDGAIPEITTEITTNKKEEEKEAPARSNPFQFFEENGFGMISGHMSEKIGQWIDDLSSDLVLEAMKIAVERGAKNWSYIEKILRDWADKKITTVEQVHAAMLAYKEKQLKQWNKPRYGSKPSRTEKLPEWFDEPNNQPPVKNAVDVNEKKLSVQEKLKKFRGETPNGQT